MTGRIAVGGRVAGRPSIEIRVRVAGLAARLEDAIAASIGRVLDATPSLGPIDAVEIARVEDAARAAGRIAVVPVARVGRRRLLPLVEAIEAVCAADATSADVGTTGARGIQLVWDGRPRRFESAVFAVLESWRGHARRCPLVLAPTADPASELLRAVALRGVVVGAKPGAPSLEAAPTPA